ncbi:MAG TPA: hypothetical protein VIN40_01260 [Candidatus Tyrphobacter sp.]
MRFAAAAHVTALFAAAAAVLGGCTTSGSAPNPPLPVLAPPGAATEYAIPTAGSHPFGLITGPDGNMWFTEFSTDKVGDVTTSGTLTEVSTLPAGTEPFGIAVGNDSRLWFAEESSSNEVAAITTLGTVTQYTGTAGFSRNTVLGPDHRIWFTDAGDNAIEAITTTGTISIYSIPTASSSPYGIALGPDGNLWFTEANNAAPKIGKITTAGVITEYPVAGATELFFIATGSDGNLWFTDYLGNHVGKMTTSGTVTLYSPPTANSNPYGITAAPNGDLYFTEENVGKIGKVRPADGKIVESAVLPSGASADPAAITSGPDGNIWFTEVLANKIGKIVP